MRILLDPAPIEGGNNPNPPATPPPPAPAPTPPPGPGQPPMPAMVPLTVEEYQRLRNTAVELASLQAEKARQVEEAERQKSLAIAEKEGAVKGLEVERSRYETKLTEANSRFVELERQYLGEKLATTIADALDGVKFVSPEAERQMRQLLVPQFAASRDANGVPTVRDALTGRPATDVIKEAIASKSYDHFLDPASRGGAGSSGTHRTEPSRSVSPLAAQLRESRVRQSGGAPGLAGTYSGAN